MKEIERRWLITEELFKEIVGSGNNEPWLVEQYYLSPKLRIRCKSREGISEHTMTWKGYGGLIRDEQEVDITWFMFMELKNVAEAKLIKHLYILGNNIVVSELLQKENKGIIILEKEFETEEEAKEFELPSTWEAIEVTNIPRFNSYGLAIEVKE